MTRPIRIIGSFVSPYVRKVLAAMNLKGLPYEVDPITPFYGNDEFERLSPLRRIPVLIDGDFTISNSSVICAYLDEAYPGHPLFPADPKERARARWLEEYADTRLGDLFIWALFYQKVVRPLVWGEPTDEERVHKAQTEEIPAALDYLEGQLPESGFLFGEIGVGRHCDRQLLSKRRLCRVRRGSRSVAANLVVRAAHAGAPLHRRPAALRGRAAQCPDQGPATGAARRWRSIDRRNLGAARASQGDDAALDGQY